MSEPANSPPLETRRLRLRPVDDSDLPFVYDLATGTETGWRWRWRGYIPRREDIAAELARDALLVMMLDDKQARNRVGLLHAYSASLHDGFVYVGIVMGPQYIGTGWGSEGFLLFANYLFAVWDLRKIYVEIPEFNVQQAVARDSKLFEVEACFKGHHYYDGRHWDKYVWAIHRDRWLEQTRPLIERLKA